MNLVSSIATTVVRGFAYSVGVGLYKQASTLVNDKLSSSLEEDDLDTEEVERVDSDQLLDFDD